MPPSMGIINRTTEAKTFSCMVQTKSKLFFKQSPSIHCMHGPAKISNPNLPIITEKNIFRFDISVNDFLRMTIIESISYLENVLKI